MQFSYVLVTGGCGFIGSHIVDRLISEGVKVKVIDDLSTGRLSNISHHTGSKLLEFRKISLCDYPLLREEVKGSEAVLHQAALVSVTRSVEDPLLVNDVNVTGTLNLLKTSVDAGVKRFIYASSSSVYGDIETLPKREDLPTVPSSPYGVSKLAGEAYCRAFCKVYGLETVCLRYFNVYGPRQTHGPYSGVIPIFIARLSEGKPPIIYGDGEQTRDFTNVKDVVAANLLALEKMGVEGKTFNIGTGCTTSINTLAKLLAEIMNTPLTPIYTSPRPGDIKHSYASIDNARMYLGYTPSVSLKEGLREFLRWLSK